MYRSWGDWLVGTAVLHLGPSNDVKKCLLFEVQNVGVEDFIVSFVVSQGFRAAGTSFRPSHRRNGTRWHLRPEGRTCYTRGWWGGWIGWWWRAVRGALTSLLADKSLKRQQRFWKSLGFGKNVFELDSRPLVAVQPPQALGIVLNLLLQQGSVRFQVSSVVLQAQIVGLMINYKCSSFMTPVRMWKKMMMKFP